MKSIFLTSLLVLPTWLSAQVIYTDINPDSLVTGVYELDIDNDDTAEFIIEATLDGGIKIVQAAGVSVQDSVAGFYGGFPQVVGYPYALSSGQPITSVMSLVDEGVMGGDHELIMEDAQWPETINRFLGLKFNINGQAHYGWAKIKISTDYAAFTISEYAYEATANTTINSGVTSVQEMDPSVSEVNLFPNPCTEQLSLNFYLRDESEIETSIYDMSGKLIRSEYAGKRMPGRQSIVLNVSQLESGMYYCRLSTGNNASAYKISVIR